ncbi:MAG: TetR/AcrR family transcriptional regulator [Phenylobacterium sp.]|nr:TetR/AcrR family transcriptional regulator [Phenylobacterium sp.]
MSKTKPQTGSPSPPRAADRILATASELFYREGARAVGVDEIVSRAGATKPSLYRAFESKDQLIAVYLQGEGERFWADFETAVAGHPDNPREQILAYFDGLGRRVTAAGYRGCGLSNAAVEYPDPAHPGRRVAIDEKARLRERLRDLTKAMDARKPKKLADSLLLLIEGACLTRQLFGENGPAAAARGAAEALIDAHARKASKEPPAPDEAVEGP